MREPTRNEIAGDSRRADLLALVYAVNRMDVVVGGLAVPGCPRCPNQTGSEGWVQ
jgi:hypothetical protein